MRINRLDTDSQLNNGMQTGSDNPVSDHHAARAVIKGVNSAITIAEIIVLISLLVFGLYAIWDNKQIDNENTASEYAMYKPTAKDTRSYDDFRSVNPDVCGWLTINDTGIDYPLVHGKDNDEYMNKTPDLQFALSGSLFLDSGNKNDFSDYNTIIYGHHMEGPSMFGALDQYVSAEFFASHREGLLYYENKWHELDVFAFLEVDAYDQQLYTIVRDEDAYQGYLDYIRENAIQYGNAGVSTNDHIIIMSTCMTDKTNGRYIAVGKIGKVTAGPSDQQTGRLLGRDGLSPAAWNLIFALIGAFIIAVLILIYLWYKRRKRQMQKAISEGTPEEAELAEAGYGITFGDDLIDRLTEISMIGNKPPENIDYEESYGRKGKHTPDADEAGDHKTNADHETGGATGNKRSNDEAGESSGTKQPDDKAGDGTDETRFVNENGGEGINKYSGQVTSGSVKILDESNNRYDVYSTESERTDDKTNAAINYETGNTIAGEMGTANEAAGIAAEAADDRHGRENE